MSITFGKTLGRLFHPRWYKAAQQATFKVTKEDLESTDPGYFRFKKTTIRRMFDLLSRAYFVGVTDIGAAILASAPIPARQLPLDACARFLQYNSMHRLRILAKKYTPELIDSEQIPFGYHYTHKFPVISHCDFYDQKAIVVLGYNQMGHGENTLRLNFGKLDLNSDEFISSDIEANQHIQCVYTPEVNRDNFHFFVFFDHSLCHGTHGEPVIEKRRDLFYSSMRRHMHGVNPYENHCHLSAVIPKPEDGIGSYCGFVRRFFVTKSVN